MIARLALRRKWATKSAMLGKGDDEGERGREGGRKGGERIPRKVYTVYNTRSSKA